jgi:glucan biosynthesis protein
MMPVKIGFERKTESIVFTSPRLALVGAVYFRAIACGTIMGLTAWGCAFVWSAVTFVL